MTPIVDRQIPGRGADQGVPAAAVSSARNLYLLAPAAAVLALIPVAVLVHYPLDFGLAYRGGQEAWSSGHPERLLTWTATPFFALVMAALIFVPAGSLKFWQGWVYMAIFFAPTIASTIYFYRHDPGLIERRMQTQEKEGAQKLIMGVVKPVFLVSMLLPGLDYRFGWSQRAGLLRAFGLTPEFQLWLTIVSQAMVLAGYLVILWVMKTNSFASSIVEVSADQQVISSGPYAIVRHPMYLGGVVLLLFTPLALGSYWALPGFLLITLLIVFRLLNEEKVLRNQLPGYAEYCRRTRYRLIPGIW